MSNNKRTVGLLITGGIAAYKVPMLARELIKKDYNVISVLTENALNFVTKCTMETVTKNSCYVKSFDDNKVYDTEHISIVKACDVLLIAPATANCIGKIAGGIADDLLTTTVMAFKGSVLIAPAMNENMYLNPVVQENIAKLKGLGYIFIEPEKGFLACNDNGIGRMRDISQICDAVEFAAFEEKDLKGKRILVTAGPTREMIDPVRFISNRSSGKMGFAIAKAAKMRGADVTLVCGPNSLNSLFDVKTIDVVTTEDMFNACMAEFEDCDIVVKAAAPSDFCIVEKYDHKIKKSGAGDTLHLAFGHNKDILMELGKKKTHQKLVGFAAETQNLKEYAQKKFVQKNLDMIVANDVSKMGAGFNYDTNAVTFITKEQETEFNGTKLEVAHKLFDLLKNVR
ncbi:MAG: bifunctional phosphopantothenoylcysteine decarboxylase/phosphopantothenate--cysteine ligase CoaBC [Clostridia bacterium]|nr:bifunctional phosphopantothenoylcysteine decarboxylase/phosphopantothenate--cysteine ligase CoaBC [Clostridia bacterium]